MLAVRVLHADGTPARGVTVAMPGQDDVTDEEGTARFATQPFAGQRIVAYAPGFLPTTTVVTGGNPSEVCIAEAAPRSVRVRVVDEQGAPVPAARVLPRCVSVGTGDGAISVRTPLAQFDGDVELLTPRTDARGEILLSVSEGSIAYDVTLGGAAASVVSEDDAVTIEMRAPQ